jgi:hypothetical protein
MVVLALLPILGFLAGPPGQTPPPEDCLPYDSTRLQVKGEPRGIWLLTDGTSRIATFSREEDAGAALALARRYSVHCFIGRHPSTRPGVKVAERANYLVHYWRGPTGAVTTLLREDCVAFDRSQLRTADNGPNGWSVTDGAGLTLTLDNEADATSALALARQYSAYCTIGRDGLPPGPSQPIRARFAYWK